MVEASSRNLSLLPPLPSRKHMHPIVPPDPALPISRQLTIPSHRPLLPSLLQSQTLLFNQFALTLALLRAPVPITLALVPAWHFCQTPQTPSGLRSRLDVSLESTVTGKLSYLGVLNTVDTMSTGPRLRHLCFAFPGPASKSTRHKRLRWKYTARVGFAVGFNTLSDGS